MFTDAKRLTAPPQSPLPPAVASKQQRRSAAAAERACSSSGCALTAAQSHSSTEQRTAAAAVGAVTAATLDSQARTSAPCSPPQLNWAAALGDGGNAYPPWVNHSGYYPLGNPPQPNKARAFLLLLELTFRLKLPKLNEGTPLFSSD